MLFVRLSTQLMPFSELLLAPFRFLISHSVVLRFVYFEVEGEALDFNTLVS
jgi:hypothetical protein